jgi:glucose-1-phosphate cytidylyltransferase
VDFPCVSERGLMKAVILAGGLGTRLSEETNFKPKPMVEVGGRPIMWHIMKLYLQHGVREFIVCCGYKGYLIKEYFANYRLHMSDVTVDMTAGQIRFGNSEAEDWVITLVDTGQTTMTGGRLARVRQHLKDEDAFCMTYGDGVSDVDIGATIAFHRAHGRAATVTAVRPPSRFGVLQMIGDRVSSFAEKPEGDGWINGGFFVLSPSVLDCIEGDESVWEREPLQKLASDDQLRAYKHDGFWHAMDTLRDRHALESLWSSGDAPWKCWT